MLDGLRYSVRLTAKMQRHGTLPTNKLKFFCRNEIKRAGTRAESRR